MTEKRNSERFLWA